MKVICFSGWTQAHDALHVIAPDAQHIEYAHADAIENIDVPHQCDLIIGWSLGGYIARELLETKRVTAKAFVSIAASQQFTRSDDYHPAMPQDTFSQFLMNYETDTARTLKRFAGLLSNGDAHASKVRDAMQLHAHANDPDVWLPWLKTLGVQRKKSVSHKVPKLHIHGAEDAIVPVAQADYQEEHITTVILPDCAHAPHYHDAQKVKTLIHEFALEHVR